MPPAHWIVHCVASHPHFSLIAGRYLCCHRCSTATVLQYNQELHYNGLGEQLDSSLLPTRVHPQQQTKINRKKKKHNSKEMAIYHIHVYIYILVSEKIPI